MTSHSLSDGASQYESPLDFPIMFGIESDMNGGTELMIQQRQETYPVETYFAASLLGSQRQMIFQEQNGFQTIDIKKSKTQTQLEKFQEQSLFKLDFPMQIQQLNTNIDIIHYNKQVAQIKKNTRKKFSSKNRILDIFIPKFKQFIKKYMLYNYPWLNENLSEFITALNNLPGMKKIKNMQNLMELFRIKLICGVKVNVNQLVMQYLGSNYSLLDALYPLQNKSGQFRVNKLGDRSTKNIIDYLPIYQMMAKVQNQDTIFLDNDLSLQNIWYYSNTTTEVYEFFDKLG